MTNWMTAAGIALIAGGIATLICFRSVIFGREGRRAGRQERAIEAAAVQPKRPVRGSRRRGKEPAVVPPVEDGPRPGPAMIGRAEEEELFPYEGDDPTDDPEHDEYAADPADFLPEPVDFLPEPAAYEAAAYEASAYEVSAYEPSAYEPEPVAYEPDAAEYEPEPAAYEPEPAGYEPEPGEYAPEPGELVGLELVPDLEPEPGVDEARTGFEREPAPGDRYGHRIAGWVRPEYRQVREEPPSGEYWTPIPVDLDPDPEPSAKGYGWPSPVERLPSVPDYEPATGFDLLPVEPEPTEVVTSLADERRVRQPRNWATRNEKREVRRERREWRIENESLPTTQLFASATDDPPPTTRRRPRPRPRPSVEPPDRSTRVYVSRHAAEPPPR
ncbi:hypothetical protein [Paractinoplanes maris]|uniref:hypothetical protein n=1 Tax=Paractinoplanes maris TaxID=1734446 RepID=UPI0020219BD8|nr:hypothetical protein [Actinoplanes maris]